MKWHIVGLSNFKGNVSCFESIQVDLLEEAGEHLSGPPNIAIWSGAGKGKPGFSG